MTPSPSKLPRGARRLFQFVRGRDALARDLDDEMQSHLAMRVDELRALGMSEHDAIAEARRRFGDVEAYRDYAERRAVRRSRRLRVREWLAEWAHDVRLAFRQARKSPGFTAVAVLTLALGIGANTAIFSVVHRLLLAPLPYANGDDVVMPVERSDAPTPSSIHADLAVAWQQHGRTVAAVAGAGEFLFGSRPDGTIDTIPNVAITANFLPLLGVRPVLGRGFTPDDERGKDPAVAMISYAMWQREYGGRRDALGKTVQVDDHTLTVVGVTPPGLNIPLSRDPAPEVWWPARLARAAGDGAGDVHVLNVFATLRPGVTTEAATRELRAIARDVPDGSAFRRGEHDATAGMLVVRPQDLLGERETRAVQVLFVAVGALLLIACANVANLLLARAWTRQREFAVRGALGAGRDRLARHVLAESLTLAVTGGASGTLLAWLGLRLIVALRPPALDHLADVRLAPAVLLWSLGMSIATGLLFGCAPMLLAGARQVGDVLRRETRGGSAGTASRRVRSTLIVLEIATSLVLLVASGLLVRSFVALQRVPLGFEPRGLVYAEVLMGGPRNRGRVPALREAVMQRIRAVPGVSDAAVGIMPGKGWRVLGGVEIETGRDPQPLRVPTFGMMLVSPEYFRVARIALVEGRLPDVSTTPTTRPMTMSRDVVVNRGLALRIAPGGHAIGARVREVDSQPGHADTWHTIVGVVDDTRVPDAQGDVAALQVYSLVPSWFSDVPIVIRTATSGDVAAPAIKRAIASLDASLYVRQVLSGDTYLRDGLAPTRFAMALLTAFAAIALTLAAVGLYGVIAYSVSQRTREIGVRVALGAAPRTVAALAVGSGLRLAAAGVAIGVVASAATTRVMRSMLFAVSPFDPLTFVAIALLVAAIALVASYVPARRALSIDPTETLRAD